jgi:protein tyrosine phosphatase
MPENLCRYKNVYPYKNNTISIETPSKEINASWVHIPTINRFIMCQAPLDDCIDDFWQMCFQYNINIIVMLCNEMEEGQIKSSTYWKLQNPSSFEIIFKEIYQDEIITIKIIEIKKIKDNTIKEVYHLHFKKWPDHKAPDIQNVVHTFEKIFGLIDEQINKEKDHQKNPIVIHCSAGIGRSGVFLTLYLLYKEIMESINKNKELISFNIFNLVRKLKEMRMYSVENINQYNFIYYFIDELLKEKNC